MRPRRDPGGRAVTPAIAFVPTASRSVASAGDDDPIRKKATSRLQVSRSAYRYLQSSPLLKRRSDADFYCARGDGEDATDATSLVDGFRHDWRRCQEATEVWEHGRLECMIALRAVLLSVISVWAARCQSLDAQRENSVRGCVKDNSSTRRRVVVRSDYVDSTTVEALLTQKYLEPSQGVWVMRELGVWVKTASTVYIYICK